MNASYLDRQSTSHNSSPSQSSLGHSVEGSTHPTDPNPPAALPTFDDLLIMQQELDAIDATLADLDSAKLLDGETAIDKSGDSTATRPQSSIPTEPVLAADINSK